MRPDTFSFLRDLLRRRSGLVVTPDKAYLLESRLLPLARERGAVGIDGLIDALRRAPSEALLGAITEAMTTNESFFFRDGRPFEQFSDVILPRMMAARAATKRLRIWCAACSTGQEPYSLAMCLAEAAPRVAGWQIEILGTDLSAAALERARAGLYSQFEVQRGLTPARLSRFFTRVGDRWRIRPELGRGITFRQHNLLDGVYPANPPFDVIFCRNVLIYFDLATKQAVLGRLSRALAPDGVLLLGGTETVIGVSDRFHVMPEQRGLYLQAHAAARGVA